MQVHDEPDPPPPPSPTIAGQIRRKPIALIGFCLLAFLAPLHVFASSADRVLAGFHGPSSTGAGASALASPIGGQWWTNADDVSDVVQVWSDYRASIQGTPATAGPAERFESAETIKRWYFSTEILVSFIGACGFACLWYSYRRRAREPKAGGERPLAEASRGVRRSVGTLALIVGWGVTGALSHLIVWSQVSAAFDGDVPSNAALFVASVLSWASVLLLFFFGLAFLLPVVTALIVNRATAASRLATAAIVVAAVALVLRQGQAEDGLRRMTAGQLGIALLAALATAIVVALAGSRGLEQNVTPQQDALPARKHPPTPAVPAQTAPGLLDDNPFRAMRSTTGEHGIVGPLVRHLVELWRERVPSIKALLPLAAVGVAFLLVGLLPALRGFVIPGALLVVLFVLSVPVEDKVPAAPQREPEDQAVTWLEVAAGAGACCSR